MTIHWNQLMKILFGGLLALFSSTVFSADPFWSEGITEDRHEIIVYRSETCGCCKGWIDHLEQHNFDVKDITVTNINPYKENMNVPPQAASCHTAIVDGVVIEGHVPAQDIKKVLQDKGDIRLLTVPRMPSGTPGMDLEGAPKQEFNVYAIDNNEDVSIFNSYSDY